MGTGEAGKTKNTYAESNGIIPRLMKALFAYVEAAKGAYDIELKMQYVELYNGARLAEPRSTFRGFSPRAQTRGPTPPTITQPPCRASERPAAQCLRGHGGQHAALKHRRCIHNLRQQARHP